MLRSYQQTIKSQIYGRWAQGPTNILAVMPCGAGKTVVMADIFKDRGNKVAVAVAHRQELVGQISMALSRAGLHHRIIAPSGTIRFIVDRQQRVLRNVFHDAGASLAVAGIDTLIRRTDELGAFLNQVKLWQTDEAHHLLASNKWGRGVEAMPNAIGVGWTATPARADHKPLGRDYGGVFDELVCGPTMRELIAQGHLCEYLIYGPPGDMDLSRVSVSSSTGDYNPHQLRDAAHKSHITGDIVAHYLRWTPGRRGITFAVDVELGAEHMAAFNQAGVPAAMITAKTPDRERADKLDAFARGDLKQVVNVDIFGEGFDLPALEVVSMARPTASYPLFEQQFCRALRTNPGKLRGVIIDHVGNVSRHGLPDAPKLHSLTPIVERREAQTVDADPVRQCPNPPCFRVFEGYSTRCPYCGFKPEARQRDRPEQVEGDLTEYSPELLMQLRDEAARLVSEKQALPRHLSKGIQDKVAEHQAERRQAQLALREAIAYWAGVQQSAGLGDAEAYRKFYRTYGIDVATAQTLDAAAQVAKLTARIREDVWHAAA